MKKLIAFDLDGTLAESKQAIAPGMAALLSSLVAKLEVAVISGGDWPQFEKQIVARLPQGTRLASFIIMPTTGTKMYRFANGAWSATYNESFAPAERDRIVAAMHDAYAEAGYADGQVWGEQIEDRGSQITFSGLGQEAPLDAKHAWDPDFTKRRTLQNLAQQRLPDLSVNVGGSTSIDITHEGTDKASAMRKLSEHTGIPTDDMLFLGDAIYPGGNDDPVRAAGMDTIAVRDVSDTMTAIRAIIACSPERGG